MSRHRRSRSRIGGSRPWPSWPQGFSSDLQGASDSAWVYAVRPRSVRKARRRYKFLFSSFFSWWWKLRALGLKGG